jgi:serine/threonine-protein kinase
MSPEQARGKQVDKRADIWAFGVVLYEMLSGERAFPGDTVTDVLAAVVTREPDWTALPAATPARVRELLTRCLEKDQQVRLRDIGEARIALNHPHAYAKSPATASTGAASLRQRILIASLAALVLLAAVGAWLLKPVPSAPLRKLEISLPGDGTSFTLSRDGRSVAFAARGHIWVRDLSTLQSRDLGAATLAQRSGIVWSPDSSALGYNTADGKFITVAARGGAPLVVCNIPETRQLMGAEWRHDGSIVLAVWRGSLYEVPASGGEPRVIVTIDPAKEIDFHEPVALPDGRVIVARHLAPAAGSEPADYSLEIIDGSRRETILANSTFQPSAYLDEGYLLTTRFDANQGVWAFRYDGRGPLRIENAVPIAPGGSFLSVGHDGTLLYSLPPEGPQPRELVWVDRTGRVTGQVGTATDLSGPMLSPDGTRVAFSARVDNTLDIWVRDVRSGAETRVSFEADDEVQPAWFPSGRRLAYRLLPGGVFNSQIMARDLGDAERHDLISALGIAVSRDGKYAAFYVDDRGRNRLRYATMGPDSVISAGTPLFKTTPEPDAGVPAFSPDGRFIAYVDRQPGGNAEIFVTRFPSGDGRWQISSGGGRGPVWARNGELFFLAGATTGAKQMMAVRIEERDTVHPSVPLKLFDIGEELDVNYLMPNFDVSADGKQLLMVRRARSGAAARWVLVQNWMAEFQVR